MIINFKKYFHIEMINSIESTYTDNWIEMTHYLFQHWLHNKLIIAHNQLIQLTPNTMKNSNLIINKHSTSWNDSPVWFGVKDHLQTRMFRLAMMDGNHPTHGLLGHRQGNSVTSSFLREILAEIRDVTDDRRVTHLTLTRFCEFSCGFFGLDCWFVCVGFMGSGLAGWMFDFVGVDWEFSGFVRRCYRGFFYINKLMCCWNILNMYIFFWVKNWFVPIEMGPWIFIGYDSMICENFLETFNFHR